MKKVLLFTFLFCFCASLTFAQTKIAIVDVQAITLQSKAGAKIMEELKALEDNAMKKYQAKETEVKALADSISQQRSSLSSSAMQEKNLEYNKKAGELERLQKDLAAELQTKQAIKLDELFKELEPVITDYAKEKNLDIVLIKQPGLMAYATPNVDITKDIISRFDIKWSKKGTK